MGRKRGLPARAREKLVAEEVMAAMDIEQKEAVMQAKPDDALFVVDAVGSERKRRKVQKEAKAAKYLSKNEKKIIVHKYLGKGGPKSAKPRKRISDPWAEEEEEEAAPSKDPALAQGGGEGSRELAVVSTKKARGKKGGGGGVGDGFLSAPVKSGQGAKRPKPTTKDLAKLGVCHPGQSYNPTEDDHEDVLATAVAVEMRRQEAVDEERKPVSQGMSMETLEVLVGDDEGESSDDDDEGGRLLSAISRGATPATGKLTRAQRNKQKRAKAAAYKVAVRKNKKEMLKSIDRITALQKEVAEEEHGREERRQTKRLFKAQKLRVEAQGARGGGVCGPSAGVVGLSSKRPTNRDVIAGRSVPVNLGAELHGSLRQLRAQGSVLLDKVELLKASKAHPDTRRGKDRAKKAPKGFRKKHTYQDRYKDE